MRFLTETALNNLSAAANQTSNAVDASMLVNASVQGVITGTAVGTLKLQASNDPGSILAQTIPADWTDIPTASVSLSSAGSFLIPKLDICYQWIRVVYTFTSGTGTVTANLKAIGF